MKNEIESLATEDSWIRRNLAILITLVSLVGIMALTGLSIWFIFNRILPKLDGANGTPKDSFSMLQSILGLVMPLIGTWMGTILAFYFSKENFEVASRSANEMYSKAASNLAGQSSFESKNAYAESRKFSEILYNQAIINKSDSEILVQTDIHNYIKEGVKGDRLPIFNVSNQARYVIHLSTVNDFLIECSKGIFEDLRTKQQASLTLLDMKDKSNNKISEKILRGVGFVSKTSSLSEVQTLMKNNASCQDVFITETGKRNEPVLGWITNARLAELSKA